MKAAFTALSVTITLLFLTIMGCGKPESVSDAMIPVQGAASFGTQCPYGTYSQPKPAKLELRDCPLKITKLELAESPRSLIFQADCKKKLLNIRSADRRVD